jgi:hypothetical protein
MRWAALASLLSVTASAQQLRLEHASEAPGCPDAETFQRAVAERLGRTPFTVDAGRTLAVKFSGQSGAFRADLKVIEESGALKGQRTLTSTAQDCSELAGSVALAVALIIDPLLATRPPPQQPDEALPQPPPPPPDTPNEQPLAPPPPQAQVEQPAPPKPVETPRPYSVLLGGGLAATLFQVPTPSAGLGGWVSFEGESWAAGLRIEVGAPAGAAYGTSTVMMMVADASPYACYKWRSLGACGLLRAGTQIAWANGPPNATSGVAPELAVGVEPFVDLKLRDALRLRFRLGAQVNLAAASLKVEGVEVYRTPLATLWLGLDLAFRVTGP